MKHKISFSKIWKVLKEAGLKWWEKDPFRESATIAYYAIFSIPALLAIILAMGAMAFGQEAVQGQLSAQIGKTMSPDVARLVEDMIVKATVAKESVWATLIGLVTLAFGATGVLVQLQKSLNNIWEVKLDPQKKHWWHTLRSRLFSFGIVVTLGFLMMVSMSITVMLVALSDWLSLRFPEAVPFLMASLNFLISLAVMTILFALVFKVLPDATIRWRHSFIGGAVTALLFMLGKFALGVYFGSSDPASAYGAAGSIILILLWVSYSSMIVFYGAEFTHALVLRTGSHVHPDKNAVHVPGLNKEIVRTNSNEKKPARKH